MTRAIAMAVIGRFLPAIMLGGCGPAIGLDSGMSPAECYHYMLPTYTKDPSPNEHDLPTCFQEPQALSGKVPAEVEACAGVPCFSLTSVNTAHVSQRVDFYCGGLTCDATCAPSVQVHYDNGKVSYLKRRTTPIEPIPY